MRTLEDFLTEKMKNPAFKAEFDALEPEFMIMRALVEARKNSGLTQKQLAEKTGITQTDISRLENGNGNPSLQTLKRLASGLGMKVEIGFSPSVNK